MSHNERRHEGRDDLTGEHGIGDAGQAILFVLFLVVWLADSFWLRWTSGLNEVVPGWLQLLVGIPILTLSGYMAKAGMAIVFGQVRETPRVIREGLFGIVRHPIYTGEMLLYIGLLCLSLSGAAAIVAVVAWGFLYYLCRHEESLLVERFGDDYRAYMRQVPMLIPRLRRR